MRLTDIALTCPLKTCPTIILVSRAKKGGINGQKVIYARENNEKQSGAGDGIRTHDVLLGNLMILSCQRRGLSQNLLKRYKRFAPEHINSVK